MDIKLNLGSWNTVFAVPGCIADEHLRLAGVTQLRVILYVLRHSGECYSLESLAAAVGKDCGDVQDALDYWIECGVLARSEGELSPNPDTLAAQPTQPVHDTANSMQETATPASVAHSVPASAQTPAAKAPAPSSRARVHYSYRECVDMIDQSEAIQNMLTAAESILSKQLNHTEIASLVTLHRWYGLSTAVIPMLVQYCVSAGKRAISYIETTGIGWATEGIDSIDAAEEKVRNLDESRRAWRKICTLLELDRRKPNAREETICTEWVNVLNLPDDVITLAYDRCINAKGKLSFSYMNGIIKRWAAQGTLTAESIAATEQPTQHKSDSGRYAPTYDLDEVERILDEEFFSDDSNDD